MFSAKTIIFLLAICLFHHTTAASSSLSTDTSSMKGSSRSNVRCSSNGDWPVNSVCYDTKCACRFGYLWMDLFQQCAPFLCPLDLACKVFPNTRCSNGACVCVDGYEVNETSQMCEKPTKTWLIVGVVLAVVAIVLLIAIVAVVFCLRRN